MWGGRREPPCSSIHHSSFIIHHSSCILAAMAPSFVRARVREMSGYTPGEQPSPGERVIKLNTNENPYPPGEKVMQAIREVEAEALRRYPNPTADPFRVVAA